MINKYGILNGTKYFPSDGLQNYLVIISTRQIYWISKDGSDSKIESCVSTRMSQESIKNLHTSYIVSVPKLIGDYQFKKVEFIGICLKQDFVSFLHKNVFEFIYFLQIRYVLQKFKHRF